VPRRGAKSSGGALEYVFLFFLVMAKRRADAGIADRLQEIAKKNERVLSYYRMDVTDKDAVKNVFAELVPRLRHPIRGLVACAGLSDNDPATEFSIERFRRLMEINVVGTFAVAQAVALEMRKADVNGSMVLVASMSGTVVNKVTLPASRSIF
jgi:NAD(P)-dependent dehydrogenase (short-subunit alcohol dehydrogenase family)